jgi:photosystem II stability/assembly factor-like uncharacterized protein/DNA-binding beta-propeller fold protein YncE
VSYTKGVEVRSISSLHITSKGPEVWYANIWGNKDAKRGFCESRDKGKTWVARPQGFEDLVTERVPMEIAIDGKDEKTLYVVAAGKIYKSSDAGQTFEGAFNGTLTYSFDQRQSGYWIAGVVVDPSNSKRVLAGTLTRDYHGGLFESMDGAKSWTQIAGSSPGKERSNLGHDAWPISLNPRSDKYVLVGGREGSAWASEDKGRTFRRADPGGAGPHTAFAMTPMAADKEVLLAESRGLWRTRDAGETWGKAPVLALGPVIGVDQDPSKRSVVYAIVQGQGLYRTENVAQDKPWDGPKHPELDAHDVVCHPHQKYTILVTSKTTGLWISTDKGDTFAPVPANGDSSIPPAVPAVQVVAGHPADPSALLAISDLGAVFASSDRGVSWARASLLGVPVTCLAAEPSASGRWLAAGPGVWRTVDGGATWQRTLAAFDPEDRVVALERGPDGAWYALFERDGRAVVSRDEGVTWDATPLTRPTASLKSWASALAVDARDPKHLLVAMRSWPEPGAADDEEAGPYESKDGGQTWIHLTAGFRDARGAFRDRWSRGAVAGIDPVDGTLFYGADGGGFFRLEPAAGDAAAWAEVAIAAAPGQATFNAFSVSLGAGDAAPRCEIVMQLEGATARSLVRSLDAGKTWAQVSDPMARIASIQPDPGVAGRYLAGDVSGDLGVLVFEPTGTAPPRAAKPPTPPAPPPDAPPPVAPGPVAPPAPAERPAGLAVFAAGDEGLVRAWDLDAGVARAEQPKHEKAVLAAVLSRDETRLYTGGVDRVVRVWDGATGEPKGAFTGFTGSVGSLALTADGGLLFAGDEDWHVTVWDTTAGKSVATLDGHAGGVTALALSPDRTRLYSGSRDGTVRVWDAVGNKPIGTCGEKLAGEVLALALSADGARLYVGGRDAAVRVLDAPGGKVVATWPTPNGVVRALALSPDGTRLYVAGDGKDVVALATADGKPAGTLSGGEKGAHALAVSADGAWVAAASEDGHVRLWKSGVAAPAWTSPEAVKGTLRAIVLTPDVPAAKPPAPPEAPAMGDAPPAMGDAPPAMGEPAPPAMDDAGMGG